MKTYVSDNSSRYCIHCAAKESEHPAGQCLFQSTRFAPHRVSGDGSLGLFTPVTLDVVIDDSAYELNALFDAIEAGYAAKAVR